MIELRKAQDRGFADHGWLQANHTFSFAAYQDPKHMGFSSLRVINEDRIAGGQGFATHPHRNMEIITYVLEGALEHKDSMGTGSVITPGEFQRMSAGSGVTHSEFNYSEIDPVHLYQIWILPNELNIEPSYEQKKYFEEDKLNKFCLVASNDGREGSLSISQDASVYLHQAEAGMEIEFSCNSSRSIWIQCFSGTFRINNELLEVSDGAAITDESKLSLHCTNEGELMLFDLP